MLTLLGPRVGSQYSNCDRVSRRNFLTVGSLGALTLADLMRLEASAATTSSSSTPSVPAARRGLGHKAIINIFLGGGPPHQDMWEIKTEAPSEIRGEFKPIDTKVPGLQIGECFPKIAAMMDKFAVLRAVVGAKGPHDAEQCMTGWPKDSLSFLGGRPSIGAALTKLRGQVDPAVPAFVGLAASTGHMPWSDCGRPGFLGPAFTAFRPDGPGLQNMKVGEVSLERMTGRRALLKQFDRVRAEIDAGGSMAAADDFGRRAFDVLTSSKLVDALDLSKEDPKVRARYGDGLPYNYQYDGAPTCNEHLLLARRLIEAGARCVSLSFGRWDSHSKNFDLVRDHGAKLDQCLTALVQDLDERGLLNDVTVIAWGEFGRTPRINQNAGRDHWPQVSSAILAGGGLRTGQAIGSTNRLGETAETRPCHFQEVVATLYHALGVDVARETVRDPAGRPQYLVEMQDVIRELA